MSKESNDELIDQLKKDIELGEGREIEFMREFPKDGHELTKEIAAFATSNPARIYLGIGKDKATIGLLDVDRDVILNRLGGLVRSNVKPPIKVEPTYIDYDGKVILRIDVPKGIEPIYLSTDIAYVRNITISDRATPDQIKAFHLEYFSKQKFLKMDAPYLHFYVKDWCRSTKNARCGIYVRNFGNEIAASYKYCINGKHYESSLPLISLKEESLKNINDEELIGGISITEIYWTDTNGNERQQKDVLLTNAIFYDCYDKGL